jgi:hypothetical protein
MSITQMIQNWHSRVQAGLLPFAGAKTGQKKYKGPPFDIFEIYFYSILR